MSGTWINVAVVVHVLVAAAIIGLVLLQHGKGADMGSGFGGGASGSLFGATGSANFLSRATAVLATIFFVTSMGLAYLAGAPRQEAGSVVDRTPPPAAAEKTEPAKPGATVPEPAAPPAPPAPANEKSVPQ